MENETHTYAQQEEKPLFIFELTGVYDKKTTSDLINAVGRYIYKARLKKFSYVAFVILFIAVILTAIPDTNEAGEYAFLSGMLLLIMPIASIRSQIKAGIRASETIAKNTGRILVYDDRMCVEPVGMGRYDFPYTDKFVIIDRDNMFVAATRQNTFGIFKDPSKYDVESFKEFISSKVKVVRHDHDMFCKKAIIRYALVLSVILVFGFSAHFLCKAQLNSPKIFRYGDGDEYSIVLTNNFSQYDDTEYITLHDKKGGYVIFDKLYEGEGKFYGDDLAELYEQEKSVVENYESISDIKLLEAGNDFIRYEYIDDEGGTELYSLVTMSSADDGVYYTEFYCLKSEKDKYKPLFEKWSKTISVKISGVDL